MEIFPVPGPRKNFSCLSPSRLDHAPESRKKPQLSISLNWGFQSNDYSP